MEVIPTLLVAYGRRRHMSYPAAINRFAEMPAKVTTNRSQIMLR